MDCEETTRVIAHYHPYSQAKIGVVNTVLVVKNFLGFSLWDLNPVKMIVCTPLKRWFSSRGKGGGSATSAGHGIYMLIWPPIQIRVRWASYIEVTDRVRFCGDWSTNNTWRIHSLFFTDGYVCVAADTCRSSTLKQTHVHSTQRAEQSTKNWSLVSLQTFWVMRQLFVFEACNWWYFSYASFWRLFWKRQQTRTSESSCGFWILELFLIWEPMRFPKNTILVYLCQYMNATRGYWARVSKAI